MADFIDNNIIFQPKANAQSIPIGKVPWQYVADTDFNGDLYAALYSIRTHLLALNVRTANSGFATFSTPGVGAGHDFVDVPFTNLFQVSQIPYGVVLTVIRTDGGPIPQVGVTVQATDHMRIEPSAQGTFIVYWEAKSK